MVIARVINKKKIRSYIVIWNILNVKCLSFILNEDNNYEAQKDDRCNILKNKRKKYFFVLCIAWWQDWVNIAFWKFEKKLVKKFY